LKFKFLFTTFSTSGYHFVTVAVCLFTITAQVIYFALPQVLFQNLSIDCFTVYLTDFKTLELLIIEKHICRVASNIASKTRAATN